jgi:hypothetical protein
VPCIELGKKQYCADHGKDAKPIEEEDEGGRKDIDVFHCYQEKNGKRKIKLKTPNDTAKAGNFLFIHVFSQSGIKKRWLLSLLASAGMSSNSPIINLTAIAICSFQGLKIIPNAS